MDTAPPGPGLLKVIDMLGAEIAAYQIDVAELRRELAAAQAELAGRAKPSGPADG